MMAGPYSQCFRGRCGIRQAIVFALCYAAAFLLCATPVYADGFLTPPASDRSVYYLSQIFGTIDAAVLGVAGGPGLMGVVFKVFNHGVLILGSILLAFYTAVKVGRASSHGKVMDERENSMWKPISITAGVVLLLPKSTGYNWVQVGFMWIILQGVGLADKVWDAALYYFSQGGGVLVNRDLGETNRSNSLGFTPFGFQRIAVTEESAADPLAAYLKDSVGENAKNNLAILIKSTVCVLTRSASDGYTVELFSDTPSGKQPAVSGLVFGPNGACGRLHVYDQNLSVQGVSEAEKNTQTGYRVAANIQRALIESIPVIQQIAPAFVDQSQPYFDKQGKTVNYNPDNLDPNGTYVRGIIAGVLTNMGAAVQNGLTDFVSQSNARVNLTGSALGTGYAEMQRHGWMFAGNYYNELVAKGTGLLSKLGGSITGALKMDPPQPQMIGTADRLVSDTVNAIFTSGLNRDNSGTAGNISFSGGTNSGTKSPILEAMGFAKFTQLANVSAPWAGNVLGNPVANLAFRGWQYTIAAEIILLASPIALFALGFFAGIGNPYNPAPTGIEAAVSFASNMTLMIVTILYTEGLLLGKYIPIIPFMMYMVSALGWMIMVFEAMIAAPIVALGLMHHEGHQWFGKAEPAVMLILNVFLRPVLIVMGFLGAMLFTHVAIDMLNIVFAAATKQMGTTAFGWMTNIALYTALVIGIMNRIFALIHQVPDKVLRWVGDTSQGMGGAEEMMHGVKAAAESAGRHTTQGFGDAAKAMGTMGHSKGKEAREERLKGLGAKGQQGAEAKGVTPEEK